MQDIVVGPFTAYFRQFKYDSTLYYDSGGDYYLLDNKTILDATLKCLSINRSNVVL